MQGTILILDGTATNRIMLKVRLSAGYYQVAQSDRLDVADRVLDRTRPDLLLASDTLPDGNIADICALRDATMPDLPLMILTRENDHTARQTALRCGADDAMTMPLHDLVLLARIRRLIRQHNLAEDLRPRDTMSRTVGLSEPVSAFERPARVAMVTGDDESGAELCARLAPLTRHHLRCLTPSQLHQDSGRSSGYDAILVGLGTRPGDPDLRFLSELRSRGSTRHAAVIALSGPNDENDAAEALDLGADDAFAMSGDPAELALRLDRRLSVKQRSDRMRDTLRRGLRAAVRDPLTGLYNRRFALPHLARCLAEARRNGRPFAVMLADIDHFKSVNDRHGHPVGDQVIAETAQRLLARLRPGDMLARVGGEEFLIVLEDINPTAAELLAQTLREQINCRPFHTTETSEPIRVTVSIGVVAGEPRHQTQPEDVAIRTLIGAADKALYAAKDQGRNAVSLATPAA